MLKFKGDNLQPELLQTATVVFRNLTKFVNLCNNTFIYTTNARPTMVLFAPHGVHHPMNAVSSEYLFLSRNDVCDLSSKLINWREKIYANNNVVTSTSAFHLSSLHFIIVRPKAFYMKKKS